MKRKWIRRLSSGALLAMLILWATGVWAQMPSEATPQPPADPTLEEQVALNASLAEEAALAGHNAWMLVSTALVLFMTAPGLAMFYSGLVRKKNVLGVMMQCIFLMGLMTVVWALWGYSLAFGGQGEAWIGNLRVPVHAECSPQLGRRRPGAAHADVQCQRSLQDPAADAHAVSGHVLHHHARADLRRVCRADEVQHDGRVHGSVGHAGLLSAVPLGVGRRHPGLCAHRQITRIGHGIAGGALDFAGGTVVHISSGVSALICALLIGKRLGFGSEADAAAQLDLHGAGRRHAVGWLVRLQRRQRTGLGRA